METHIFRKRTLVPETGTDHGRQKTPDVFPPARKTAAVTTRCRRFVSRPSRLAPGRGAAHQFRPWDAPAAKGRGSQKRRSLLLRPPPPTRRRRRRQRPSSRRPRCRPSHAGFAPTCATQDPNSRCGCRLSWFQKSLKQAVATEIQQKAEAQTDVLETKMAAVMAALV